MVDEQNGWEKLSDNPLIEFKEGNSTVDGDEELASVEEHSVTYTFSEGVIQHCNYNGHRYIRVEWEKEECEETDKSVIFKIAL